MSDKIMQIPVDDLLESLKSGYEEYKECLENGHDEDDLSHIKGFCVTLEQMLASYGGITSTEMLAIKKPIIGNISLRRKQPKVNYDIPTVFRNKKND